MNLIHPFSGTFEERFLFYGSLLVFTVILDLVYCGWRLIHRKTRGRFGAKKIQQLLTK
jgi:hypothetical protein